MMSDVPSGTVTFLFTDIEGSTTIAREYPADWERLRACHHAILRTAIEAYHGYVFQIVGDAFCSAFHTASDGVHAAVQAQRQLQAEPWGETPIRVRMGIHTGEAQARDGEYLGYLTLTRMQRLMSAAYGGQILLSDSSAILAREALPTDLILKDLGEHRLKSLPNAEHIWQVCAPDLRQDFPPLESLRTVPNNLPVELTSFVGREAEIARVRRLLRTRRLVSLTGPGGTGKTRLALQVAAEALEDFKEGVWFIELASLSDPALVPHAAASALGVREEPGRSLTATLLEWLENRELLLVLDSCEHLIEACAQFAVAVLHASRASCLLPTSREALGIAGESVYQVPPLESPEPAQAAHMPIEVFRQYPAVLLFTERATDSVPTFNVTPTNAPAVAQVCHRLDGIPLALELAAARVKILRVEQIAERLNDRFHLLTDCGRTALPRHQTLRSLIDWSHSLLSKPEQVLFRRLSVFAGGWTLDAAEQVCAGDGIQSQQVLDLLARLVEKSLVLVGEGPGEARYRMLETIRQYAQEESCKAGEETETRNRHLHYMLGLTETAEPHLQLQDQLIWLDRLDMEMDNLRAALGWAGSLTDTEPGLRLAGSAWYFCWMHGYYREAQQWLRQVLEKAGSKKRTLARAKALFALGWFLWRSRAYAEGRELLEESIRISRAIGDRHSLAVSLLWLGVVRSSAGDLASSRRDLEESLALARELGDKHTAGCSLCHLGDVRLSEENEAAARVAYEESAVLLRESGDHNFLAYPVRRLGHLFLRQHDYDQARALCTESLRLNMEVGDKQGVAACLAAVASIAATEGSPTQAARLYGATHALEGVIGVQLLMSDQTESQPYMLATRAALGEEAYSKAFSEGHAMSMEQAIACALEQAAGSLAPG